MTETTVQIEAGTLTANLAERIVTGLLLPFGEVGRTNLGRFSVRPDAVTLPRDPSVVTVNDAHRREVPLGRAVSLAATDAGIVGTFRIADTVEGDELLAEVADAVRTDARRSLSAEVANVVIRAGEMVAGRLFGAALCVKGAFPSAALVASDVGDDPQNPSDGALPASLTAAPSEATTSSPDDETNATNDNETEETMTDSTAAAPVGVPLPGAPREDGIKIETTGDLFAAVAKANETGDARMFAALADITEANHAANIAQPQFVGELWSGVAYERQIVPLFNHADLTSHKVNGWRWVTKPQVAPYAGNKADVPSNATATEAVSIAAQRIAGAHDIDRRYRDFNDTSFFESYYRAMTESYAEVSDTTVLDEVVGALTPTPLGASAPAGTPAALAAVVQGYYQVLRATRSRPTFALVSDTLHEALVYTKEADRLAYLEQLLGVPLSSNFFVPTTELADDQVLVGAKSAVTVHELGGGAPIRVEALDVARGGVDAGVFGYLAVNIHNEAGLALIDTNPGA